MIIEVELLKKSTKEREKFELWNVDVGKIAAFVQSESKAKLDVLVHGLIREKLPTYLYPYEIVNWEFKLES